MSRGSILNAVKNNQPEPTPLPVLQDLNAITYSDAALHFKATLEGIGAAVVEIASTNEILSYLQSHYTANNNFVTTVPSLEGFRILTADENPHALESVEVAVIAAQFGVAENGAVWVTENDMVVRAAPFICQQLAVILHRKDILNNMHEAYQRIGSAEYGFGAFIAGPSKTADIEQSLVLGAHGPKGMVLFLLG